VRRLSGVEAALLSALLSALMGAALLRAREGDPTLSSSVVSFVRVFMNALWVAAAWARVPSFRTDARGGLGAPVLLWGIFGALTVTSYFAALLELGMGLTTFLQQIAQTAAVVALSSAVAGQVPRRLDLAALAGALAGFLLLRPQSVPGAGHATALAVLSGLAAALAYLMVARVRETRSPFVIMASWCAFATLAHVGWILVDPPAWPRSASTWGWIALGGALAAGAQYLVTLSYQRAAAPRVTALLYAAPALGFAIDALVFGMPFSARQLAGVAVVLACGVGLPLLRSGFASGRARLRARP
jgi:drug/metabolite transporter (DMT)-like permease